MGLKPRVARKKRKSVLDGLQSVNKGWKETFRDGQGDLYPCPACKVGRLSPVVGTFQKNETLKSRRTSYEDDPYIPVYEHYRFSGLLVCAKKGCEEVASVSGLLEVVKEMREVDGDYGELQETTVETSTYRPDAIVPAPRLFVAPPNCPENIAKELDRAFKLFWIDDRACANSIRSAVELFVDHEKVAVTAIGKKRKRRLSLHERIVLWDGLPPPAQQATTLPAQPPQPVTPTPPKAPKDAKRAKLANALLAIKFIGNEGSHGSKRNSVTRDDIYDGFTLFKYVLDEVFTNERHAKAIEAMAKKIIKRKKPRSQHKKAR